jgi:glycosyltransferase involved in cell wall biosynthesis
VGALRVDSFENPRSHPRRQLAPVRIVYCLANTGYGGTEVHLRELVLGLDREQFEPMVLLSESEPMRLLAEELRDAGISVGSLPTATRQLDLRTLVDLVRIIRARRADIVHVHMPWPVRSLRLFLAARLAGVPVVMSTEHSHAYHLRSIAGFRGCWLRAIARVRTRISDRVIAVSAAQAASFEDVLAVRAAKLTVIPNGIDSDRFSPDHDGSALRNEFGISSSAPLAGMVTSYVEYERAEDFVRAAAHVRRVLPQAEFLLVGDKHPGIVNEHATQMRSSLEHLARELGVDDRVHFVGFRTDMPRIMAALDVFVLPARYKCFGLVLLEAMTSELPVVATAAGGVPEIVQDGETGHLVPALDPPALGAAMVRVLSDSQRAARMGRHGRRRVEQLFTSGAMIERTTTLYRSLLARRHR